MGAFGRLLIKHWGGNIDKYEGNIIEPKKEPIKKEQPCECGENTTTNCPSYYCKKCCRTPHNCVCSH